VWSHWQVASVVLRWISLRTIRFFTFYLFTYWGVRSQFENSWLSLLKFVIGITFCIVVPNFIQIGQPAAEIMMPYRFSRWRPLGRNFTSEFRFRIGWRFSLQKANVYQQTKLCRDNSIHGRNMTISGLEKQTSAILEFFLRFRLRPYCRKRDAILRQAAKFQSNRTILDRAMMPYRFSRWRPLRSNFTSSFGILTSPSLKG